jgi:hypothetical protein
MSEARLNALVAVELDPVRRRERIADLRLAAAVTLARKVVVAEALLAGLPVPAARLDPVLVRRLGLAGDVALDEELALRVVAAGPLDAARVGGQRGASVRREAASLALVRDIHAREQQSGRWQEGARGR